MSNELQLNPESEFILISHGDEYKKVKYSDLVSYFDSRISAYEASETGVKGEKGIKGQKGDAGAKGLQGYTGLTGITGAYGNFGVDGEKGEKGDRGDIGLKGDTGAKGVPGTNGNKGIRGDFGEKGQKGEQGERGEFGVAGEKGEKGYDGNLVQGMKGRKGVKGYGRRGNPGDKGQKGEPGEMGDTGDKGYTGFVNNIITKATDLEKGTWTSIDSNIMELKIADEFSAEYSRVLIKIKKGRYYDRFNLNHTTFCEIGTQLNDPLRNCSTTFSHLVHDSVTDTEIPIQLITEETSKLDNTGTLIIENYIVCKIFYDSTNKKVPFSTFVTDKF